MIFMKKLLCIAICLIACGCSNVEIKKEQKVKVDMSKYRVIHLGWIDYPVGQYKLFLHKSPGEWQPQIMYLNQNYLIKYFRKKMSRKTFIGPTNTKAIPGGGDLFIKFDFLSYENNFNYGWGGNDYLNLRVEMYDIRKQKRIYSGVLRITANEPGQGDWSVYGIMGRLEMQIRNLVKFIAGKF
jgi:hypothetical protein